MHHRVLPFLLAFLTIPAHAVIVQGKVTSVFGKPVPGARIQLITLGGSTRSVANAVSGLDGTYEIRSTVSGRFLLLTTSSTFAPQIGTDFYAGRTHLILRDIFLDLASLTPLLTSVPLALEIPLAQESTHITQISADRFTTRAFVPDVLSLAPATSITEHGQIGQPALISLRGAPADSNVVLLDDQPIQQLGSAYNFGNLSSTGFAIISSTPAVEIAPNPNPLYPLAAEAGIIAFHTTRAANDHPTLTYSGDAGNLHTWRDEAAASLTHTRTDIFAAFSRFDTSNALPNDRFHSASAAANLGYNISAATSLRLTLRNTDSAAPLPIPHDLGLTPNTKQADQDLFGTFTFETRTAGNWHNLVRYGVVRSRDQTYAYLNPIGRLVTLTGANGDIVTGRATPFPIPARQDQVTDRDEAGYETDYPLTHFLTGLFTFRYQNERALNATPAVRQSLARTNLVFVFALRAELKHRLFAEASGSLTHSSLIGLTGAPRLGLTYVPVLAGTRPLKGTAVHLTVATGNREPTLPEESQNIVIPIRSRTFDLSGDQTLYRQKLTLHAGYFHNQFAHQTEVLSLAAPANGIGPTLSGTQAFRAQGFLSELRYRPFTRLLLTGGYTYLASYVEHSAATPVFNPLYPTIPIGITTALARQRPFNRPPHSGFFLILYTGRKVEANLQASLASSSDDSTFNPTLLLSNRGLDHGYARLDGNVSYAIFRHVTIFTQLTNLLNDQHIAPVGYPSTPFTFRSGLKIRFGRE